jgi:opacity protein-like surface antigen
MSLRFAVLALASLTCLRPAAAQTRGAEESGDRAIQFGIGGGAVVPRTNIRAQDVLTGTAGQAYLLVRIAKGFPALRIGADFSRLKFGDPRTQLNPTQIGDTRTQLGGVASLKFDLLPGPVRPYIMAGVGAFNIRDALVNVTNGSNTFSSTQIGVDGGAGLSIKMGRIRGFLETRLQNVYTKQQGLINTNSIQAFPVTFGLIF